MYFYFLFGHVNLTFDTIVRTLREDQPLTIVSLITRTALYSVSKET